MKKLLGAIFVAGQCVRLLHADPWQQPTFKIYEAGESSYFGESAIQQLPGWTFISGNTMQFTKQHRMRAVKCPAISWDQK